MTDSIPESRRVHLKLGFSFLLILLIGGSLAWMLARQGVRSPLRVLLVTPAPGGEAGVDAAECRALGALVQDHLEYFGACAVTSVTELPGDLEAFRRQPNTLLVVLEPRRKGDQLELAYRFVWGRHLGRGGPHWTSRTAKPQPPLAALEGFLAGFPQRIPGQVGLLVPRQAPVFWDLVRASAWRYQNRRLDEAMALAEGATRKDPDCATAWVLLGNLRYRNLLNDSSDFRQEQAEAEACLRRGLALAPGHPRGTFLQSLMRTDSGNQREALELLLDARQRQPHNPTLLTGITYAARGAGLLPLARRAMDLRDDLAFASVQPQAVDITCLYTGETARFEASLQEQPGHLRSTTGVLPFYRGYLALVKGDRPAALREFRTAAELAHGYPNIQRLSEIYILILDGKLDLALSRLRDYDQERIGMREPDGEFTLRMAEAYALAGDRASAMEMASRAFARGFGCTEWYQRSPMLEPLRGLPKWKALLQHLRERQALMEDRFPLGLLESA